MKWYFFRKRYHAIPLQFPLAYYFFVYTKKNLGIKVGPILIVHDGKEGAQQTVIDWNGFEKVGGAFLRKVEKYPKFLLKQVKKGQRTGVDFVRWSKRYLLTNKLLQATNQELTDLLSKYKQWYQKFALDNVVWWVFLEDRISKKISENLLDHPLQKEIQKNYHDLVRIFFVSYTQKEHLDFLKFVDFVKHNGISLLDKFESFKNNKLVFARFKKLVQKYFWIPWDYTGPDVWDEEYYFKKISDYLKLNIDPQKEINDMKREMREAVLKQKFLIKKLKISTSVVNLIKSLQAQSELQDDKKAVTTESHFYLGNLFLEISRRINIARADLYLLSFEEMGLLLIGRRVRKIKNDLKNRKKFCLIISNEGKVKILSGSKARKAAELSGIGVDNKISDVTEITGVSACVGKSTGIARVLLNAGNINSFKENEILIAPMTTPDFVPAMRKAAAIVTDEGGVTCHAAIVSREMKKPCVIGTKVATQIFKDGDRVEVDAEKGIVRKIS